MRWIVISKQIVQKRLREAVYEMNESAAISNQIDYNNSISIGIFENDIVFDIFPGNYPYVNFQHGDDGRIKIDPKYIGDSLACKVPDEMALWLLDLLIIARKYKKQKTWGGNVNLEDLFVQNVTSKYIRNVRSKGFQLIKYDADTPEFDGIWHTKEGKLWQLEDVVIHMGVVF